MIDVLIPIKSGTTASKYGASGSFQGHMQQLHKILRLLLKLLSQTQFFLPELFMRNQLMQIDFR